MRMPFSLRLGLLSLGRVAHFETFVLSSIAHTNPSSPLKFRWSVTNHGLAHLFPSVPRRSQCHNTCKSEHKKEKGNKRISQETSTVSLGRVPAVAMISAQPIDLAALSTCYFRCFVILSSSVYARALECVRVCLCADSSTVGRTNLV